MSLRKDQSEELTVKAESCDYSPCQNQGICWNDDQAGGYTCVCLPKYTGPNCDFDLGIFELFISLVFYHHNLKCIFKIDVTDCYLDDLCLNGGICRNLTDAFKCICPPGYSGLHCEEKLDLVTMHSLNPNSLIRSFERKEFTANELEELVEKVSGMVDAALTDQEVS